MSVQVLRALLLADAKTQSFVGDKIGPRDAMVDQVPPYLVLAVEASTPLNNLQGFAGLNRSEIEVTAWAKSYQDAVTIANAVRAAVEAAGNGSMTIHEPGDLSAFQGDVALYGHAYVFQIFDSDD